MMTKEMKVFLHNVPENAKLSLLRSLSAPVKLKVPKSIHSIDHLAFQMANDQDWFNRYDASQKFATHIILNKINDTESDCELEQYLMSFRKMLNDNDVDAALKASALTLPSFENLNDEFLNDSNPDAICKARKALKIYLADTLKEEFCRLLMTQKIFAGENINSFQNTLQKDDWPICVSLFD